MFLALLSSCDPGDQIVMTSVTSSTIAWMRLNKHYTNKSHNHIMSLKKCLSFVTKDTSRINSYLHSILLIANKLSLIGHPLDDLDLVIIALNGPSLLSYIKTHSPLPPIHKFNPLILSNNLKRSARSH